MWGILPLEVRVRFLFGSFNTASASPPTRFVPIPRICVKFFASKVFFAFTASCPTICTNDGFHLDTSFSFLGVCVCADGLLAAALLLLPYPSLDAPAYPVKGSGNVVKVVTMMKDGGGDIIRWLEQNHGMVHAESRQQT